MKRFKALSLAALMALSVLVMNGCWSSKEIEELGLIIGTALDLESEGDFHKDGEELFIITNQLVTAEATDSGTQEGTANTQSYENISETGEAILPALRQMLLRINKRAFGEHSKVIVIGEDLARNYNLEQVLDFFQREQEMRPSALIVIAKESARKTLETNEPTVIPAIQLVEMIRGHERTTKIMEPMSITKLEAKLSSGISFLLHSVLPENGERIFSGGALIDGKTKKLRGFFNDEDIMGVNWITGKAKGGLVSTINEETGQPIVYEILTMDSKIKPKVDGTRISFEVTIKSQGRIGEHWDISEQPFDNSYLQKAEKAAEKKVEELVKNVLAKAQEEYRMDVFGFGNRLRIEHPKLWNKVKEDWDQAFSDVPVNVTVELIIKEFGTSG